MNNNSLIQINEFCRELIPNQINGRWVSTGYQNEIGCPYPNVVPDVIKKFVEAGLFRIEDAYGDHLANNYALIAREVEQYSVLAVATKLIEDGSRPGVSYRYFWLDTSGNSDIDGILTLLFWWKLNSQPKYELDKQGKFLEPEQYQAQIYYQNYFDNNTRDIESYLLLFEKKPVSTYLLNPNQDRIEPYLFHLFHHLAFSLHKNYQYNQPLAWAFNVPLLAKPNSFNLIQCIDEKSHQIIFKQLKPISVTKYSPDINKSGDSNFSTGSSIVTYSPMKIQIMFERIAFYLVAGIFSALIGWNLSQILILDIPFFLGFNFLPFRPDFILLPFVSTFVAVAMVVTEVFISNPTRHRANWRNLKPYLKGAVQWGLGIGIGTAILTAMLYLTGLNAGFIRVISWSVVGLFIGLNEGLSWRSRSIEGGTDKGITRLWKSTLFGFVAGLIAAVVIEMIRQNLGGYEDPIGFMILGLALALSLSFAAAPTYQVALRAGAGFEAIDPKTKIQLRLLNETSTIVISPNRLASSYFENRQIIYLSYQGVSITRESPLIIGSGNEVDIMLTDLASRVAEIIKDNGQFKINFLNGSGFIEGKNLPPNISYIPLKHNDILVFDNFKNPNKPYRFLFYDIDKVRPELKNSCLRFVTEDENYNFIEEGLSIQLPSKNNEKLCLTIGSGQKADIYLPNIPTEAVQLVKKGIKYELCCLVDNSVAIQGKKLSKNKKTKPLLHNQILTFYYENNPKKYYRFVFYDRFLDPEG